MIIFEDIEPPAESRLADRLRVRVAASALITAIGGLVLGAFIAMAVFATVMDDAEAKQRKAEVVEWLSR